LWGRMGLRGVELGLRLAKGGLRLGDCVQCQRAEVTQVIQCGRGKWPRPPSHSIYRGGHGDGVGMRRESSLRSKVHPNPRAPPGGSLLCGERANIVAKRVVDMIDRTGRGESVRGSPRTG